MKSVVLLLILMQAAVPHFNQVADLAFDGDARLLTVADLDGNRTGEILIWNSAENEVTCYDYKGVILWTLQVTYPVLTAAAEDLDGNNQKEIFLLEDVPEDSFYTYRITRVEADGTASWRKLIEMNIPDTFQFHFINADGKEGKEIVLANRVILQGGLERLAFERNRIIIAAEEFGGSSYFLTYQPDVGYELYPFDTEPLWQGQACEISGTEASMNLLLCTLFYESEVCSCFEDWTFTESTPAAKSVRLWSDITGDMTEEAVFYTDTTVQVIDSQGTTVWTWESPEFIQEIYMMDMTGDVCSEIAVLTPVEGSHVPSLYVLDCTGTLISVFALNLRGIPTVIFSDMDGDTDPDIVTFSQGGRKSTLTVYTNTVKKGSLDDVTALSALEVVNPSGFTTQFWKFWARYQVIVIAAVIICVAVIAVIVKKYS